MSGTTGSALIAAACLMLAGCEREAAPVAAGTAPAEPLPRATTQPSLPEPPSSPVAAASAEPSELSGTTYAPRDDCAAAPGWPAFRKTLVSAITARDATALAALASADITLDYGGGSGVEELKKRLADPERHLWHQLDAILPLGCALEGGLVAMPWVFWNVPDDIDSYSAMLITSGTVNLLDRPGGRTKGNVGWFIVGIDPMGYKPDARMTQVTLANGDKGWVPTSRLRSLLDYRLIAEPKDGGWQITAFIAGD
ncbi:MAG: hypothetical protein C0409_03540 [Novosphingobium sp.]|nr:hypothetical protein [Novosphingobium sp.]